MNRGGFSWNRLLGISAAKARLSRTTGVPPTRSGRQTKVGAAMACLLQLWLLAMVALVGAVALAALSHSH
jgi:hypothetical protein